MLNDANRETWLHYKSPNEGLALEDGDTHATNRKSQSGKKNVSSTFQMERNRFAHTEGSLN